MSALMGKIVRLLLIVTITLALIELSDGLPKKDKGGNEWVVYYLNECLFNF